MILECCDPTREEILNGALNELSNLIQTNLCGTTEIHLLDIYNPEVLIEK